MPQMKMMKVTDISVVANVRKSYDEQELAELTASVKAHGILQPLLVMKIGRLLAGHRRLLAANSVGLEVVPVIITDEMLTDAQVKVIQLTENLSRSDLTDPEVYEACAEIMRMHPEWQNQQLAEQIGKSAAMVTRIRAVDKLIPEAKQAFLAGKFRFRTAHSIGQLSSEDQPGLLAMHLSGMAVEQISALSSKKRQPNNGPAVKVAKFKAKMPSGEAVQATGQDLTLARLIDLLADLHKQAKAGLSEGMDIKAFMALLDARAKDKAKK